MRFRLIAISMLLVACSNMSASKLPTLLEPYKMDIRQGNAVTPEMRARLKLGMTRKQVHLLLGTALIQDPFHANRWDYYYSFSHQGELEQHSLLTLYFEGDTLVRIDDNGKVSNAPLRATSLAPTKQQPAAEPGTSPGTKQ
jgi:outer membrane protein assembly factor BamE